MMQITESIINRINQLKEQPILVGISGRAGSGKSTIAQKIKEELSNRGINSIFYSGDWRFRLDSQTRKKFIEEKWLTGLDEYLRAINQFNWWDFEKIREDLTAFKKRESILIKNGYDRETGKKDNIIELASLKEGGVIFYENCILGGSEVLSNLDIIILLNTPDNVCFQRLVEKDSKRRTFPEILARELMTFYSENIFFKFLLEKFPQKLLVCDSNGIIGEFLQIAEVSYVPVPIFFPKETKNLKGAIFCDLDGTLIKHVPVPSETGEEIEIIEGSAEKLKEFKEKGYYLILVTSRPHYKTFSILNKLKSFGMEFDQIISDLPVGARHLINDSKDQEVRAVSHSLERNKGIRDVRID
ncbi:MAG: HAD hydrolase family protein [Patescibacteria group bacterium]